MTREEQERLVNRDLPIIMQAIALEKEGEYEEADALQREKIPMPPWMARVFKEKMGLDYLLAMKWNMTEVEAAYGKEWLEK
ncbi:MAG: hypothetical protein LBT35_02325 [Tannerella sp.]|jgi:hypothetical protein|nr:hypothetical protein [Tannerella sp.]